MTRRQPRKRPSLNPQPRKIPHRLEDPVSFDDRNFCWRVHDSYIDYSHPQFGWGRVSILDFLRKIIQALQSYEGCTWHEVREKKHCHPWGVDAIPRECAKRLAQRQIDVEQLYQISLGNKPRIIGYKDRGVFYLMWWDKDHEFCPTKAR